MKNSKGRMRSLSKQGDKPNRGSGNKNSNSKADGKSKFGNSKSDGDRKSFSKSKSGDKKNFASKSRDPRKSGGRFNPKIKDKAPVPAPFEEGRVYKSDSNEMVRLNKYISNAGICSRREADVLIAAGVVAVNGKVITELGFKVAPGDNVQYDGESISKEKPRYFLLNKPKGYITTMDDPDGRKTVMALVKRACKERIYPVGRLDRNTTGLLLFTNDGDMAKRLTHPKHGHRKIYHIELAERVKPRHLNEIKEGVELEDGIMKADDISFVGDDMHQIGIEIHSGKNRIVRRLFEHFGYKIKKLDRVMFAGLTKKDLSRGMYRELTAQEIGYLKMIR